MEFNTNKTNSSVKSTADGFLQDVNEIVDWKVIRQIDDYTTCCTSFKMGFMLMLKRGNEMKYTTIWGDNEVIDTDGDYELVYFGQILDLSSILSNYMTNKDTYIITKIILQHNISPLNDDTISIEKRSNRYKVSYLRDTINRDYLVDLIKKMTTNTIEFFIQHGSFLTDISDIETIDVNSNFNDVYNNHFYQFDDGDLVTDLKLYFYVKTHLASTAKRMKKTDLSIRYAQKYDITEQDSNKLWKSVKCTKCKTSHNFKEYIRCDGCIYSLCPVCRFTN